MVELLVELNDPGIIINILSTYSNSGKTLTYCRMRERDPSKENNKLHVL